jgi:hypothetical protein
MNDVLHFKAARLAAIAAAALALACVTRGGRVASPSSAAVASEPLEVARGFYGALHSGDASRAARYVASSNAGPATAALVTLSRAYQSLEAAMRDRFGAAAARAVGYTDRVAAEDAALAAARADVDGDRAVVRAGDETLATLHRVRGTWRIVLEDALATDQGIAALVLEAESCRDAAARVIPAIRGGLFDAPQDALEAFKNDVALRMQGARPDLPRAPPGQEPREPEGVPL